MITLNKNGTYESKQGYVFEKKYDPAKLIFTKASSDGAYDLIVEHCAIATSVKDSVIADPKPNWRLIAGVAAGTVLAVGIGVMAVRAKGASAMLSLAGGLK